MLKGFASRLKENRLAVEPVTANRLGEYRHGIDVSPPLFGKFIAADNTEAGTTNISIVATAHVAREGDLIFFTTGPENGTTAIIESVSANAFVLSQNLKSVPVAGSSFDILRPTPVQIDSSNGLISSLTSSYISGEVIDASDTGILTGGKESATKNFIPFLVTPYGAMTTTEYGPLGQSNFYSNPFGLFEIPTTQIADPNSALIAGVGGGVAPTDLTNGLQIIGNLAHDAADTSISKPVKIGARAVTSHISPVANGDRVDQIANTRGFSGTISMFDNRQDTFSSASSGTTIDCSFNPLKRFSLQVVPTGTVTSWTVVLEGSNDNTNFTTIISHTNADGSNVKSHVDDFPVRYFRARCSAIVLGVGTNVVANILGVQ